MHDGINSLTDFGFLKEAVPGDLLFAKVAGSHGFNLATPESDMDFLAVYVAPTPKILSIDPPAETVDHMKPDWTAHEVGKFCRLLIKGNPNIVETLFTNRSWMASSEWWELRSQAKRFLSKRVVTQYLGYCQGQLHKLAVHGGTGGLHTAGGAYKTKWAYHMVRLTWDASDIAEGREPVLWKEGTKREDLMAIRRGEWSQERVENHVREMIAAIDARKPWPLPDEGDKPALNAWLLGLRRRYMEE